MSNRLSGESSPYLLQHADNPVDWYPWGEEALSRARREDRPILLSIGYSACHWCHVMERESFEDSATAALMNEFFVNVKVDREERPDVDQIYMRAVQAMTGGGGWPLTVFLTPGGEPYYGGTYFPPEPRHGMPSFRQVLEGAARTYRDRPEEVREAAGRLVEALRASTSPQAAPGQGEAPGTELLDEAYRTLARRYDAAHGGFGQAPKFPQPVTLEVLLRHHVRTGDGRALEMLLHTLRRMAGGGLRDHLGGGFHRYSVDARWLVPHFEKMLYDNALLARIYVDAWRATGLGDLRDVAEETLDYLIRDMRAPDGGFYTARDADSEGEEGRFYVWTPEEVREALEPEAARLFLRSYDVTEEGNFEGRNILHLPHDLDAVARSEGLERAELNRLLSDAREALRSVRSRRTHPFRDEKVLVGWNGMALRAFAEAGAGMGREDFLAAARRGADFVLATARPEGRLLHVIKDGRTRIPAFLEDHAALGNAFLSLHEATLEPRWLREARWCCDELLERFWDPDAGCFFDSPSDGEALVARPRNPMDNATPSGNSLAAELLARAGHLFDDDRYRNTARRVLTAEAPVARRHPGAFGRLLSVADRLAAAPVEVTIVGPPGDDATGELLERVARRFLPGGTVVGHDPTADAAGPALDAGDIPLLAGRGMVEGRPAAYVCRGYACRAPVTEPDALDRALDGAGPSTDPPPAGPEPVVDPSPPGGPW